jgi:predicted ArsR family transcriptional regulator
LHRRPVVVAFSCGEEDADYMTDNAAVRAFFPPVVALPVPLDRDAFLSSLIGELAGTLQEAVGREEATGLMSAAGRRVGKQINREYKAALAVSELPRARVSEVLMDVSRRIHGDFYIIEEDEEKIVLGNPVYPFSTKIGGRPAMCMMACNALGAIAAENLGYARVVVEKAIAEGAPACRVVVHLRPSPQGGNQAGPEDGTG